MPILDIKKYPAPILKTRAEKVREVNSEIKQLAQDMIETTQDSNGAGLSAPQVGVSKRIIVADAGDVPCVFINPEILKRKGKEIAEEGCLSFPGIFFKIKRASEITCRFLDENGRRQEMEIKGLLARIVQHETDHLDGILIIDRVNFLKRRKALGEYNKQK
ncbi:peptide deformylase [Patescibacteria group bacterium]|nr:peptide deformylase [Patescibacteria group bacterium]MBU4512617.1 peptide deformylase [Patescibacteria group bacterium]MCG2693334.1 peptide deformylase [Candidatus Parcubacteria bacterium]